jgi:hypothetical protein
MEKYGFVYIWYDRKHKKYYIGSHWGSVDDGYICSSTWMRNAYKYRKEDFKRKIIARVFSSKSDLLKKEYEFLSLIKEEELGKKYYNMSNHLNGHWFTDEERAKTLSERISKKTKEAMYRPEVREKYLNGLKTRNTRSSDPEVREKRRISMIGKNVGKDNSKAIAASAELRRGKPLSEEHKQKVKDAGVFKELNSKKIKCLYCDFEGNVGNIGRYHNEKCKHKPK